MDAKEAVIMRPIGQIRNKLHKGRGTFWKNTHSEIIIDERLTEGLSNIDEYTHIVVIFWMDRVPPELRDRTLVNVPYAPIEMSPRGVFSTRIPERPNPIGISVVPLVRRKDNILLVRDLDAFDGTPVLDIKPFTGHILERVSCFGIPVWEPARMVEHGCGE